MGQPALFAKSPVGIFIFDENSELIYFKLFNKNPEKAVEEFLKSNETSVKELKKEVVDSDTAYRILRKRLRDYAITLGFAENEAELNRFLSDFGYTLSKKKLAGIIGKDRLVIQATNALEDLNKVINLFQERLYEWFSLHYPEVKNTKDFAEKVISYGRRERFPNFKDSTGIGLNEKDEEILVEFATTIQNLLDEKEMLENYVKNSVKEVAPNLSSLLDPILAARLLTQAGSLEKLARMPASTIQLLGAEKALFRHLHKKGKSPKYGIIFASPAIQNASNEKKGKAARILSSKLMLAARIDHYSGRYEERLKKELEEELQRL